MKRQTLPAKRRPGNFHDSDKRSFVLQYDDASVLLDPDFDRLGNFQFPGIRETAPALWEDRI